MKKKPKFNAVIFREDAEDRFIYMKYDNGTFKGESFVINFQNDIFKEEFVNGKFPENKIVLANISPASETELDISPRYFIELKFEQKPVSFIEVARNQDYLEYLLWSISKKI